MKRTKNSVGRPSTREAKYCEFSERLQHLMAQHGMTRRDMVKALGCNDAVFGNYYNGWRLPTGPSIKYAIKMAEILNVTLGYLLDGKKDEEPKIIEVPQDPFDGFTDQEKNLLRKAFLKLVDLLKS